MSGDLRKLEARTCGVLGIPALLPACPYRFNLHGQRSSEGNRLLVRVAATPREFAQQVVESFVFETKPELLPGECGLEIEYRVVPAAYPRVATDPDFELVIEKLKKLDVTMIIDLGTGVSRIVGDEGSEWHEGATWREAVCRAVCELHDRDPE